jgi:phage terminase large subunit
VIPNQGKGAAMLADRGGSPAVPAHLVQRATTEAGRDALGAYHEKRKDEKRNIGLGPEHDWSSHGADAFGLMCVAYEEPRVKREAKRERRPVTANSWMGR